MLTHLLPSSSPLGIQSLTSDCSTDVSALTVQDPSLPASLSRLTNPLALPTCPLWLLKTLPCLRLSPDWPTHLLYRRVRSDCSRPFPVCVSLQTDQPTCLLSLRLASLILLTETVLFSLATWPFWLLDTLLCLRYSPDCESQTWPTCIGPFPPLAGFGSRRSRSLGLGPHRHKSLCPFGLEDHPDKE